jgi:Fur family ferric uptake transcriptional regulator
MISTDRRVLAEELASKGVRMTAQRRAVIEAIQTAPEHVDAESLLSLAKRSTANIDRATVYRTIELLKKHGLIDELDLMHLEGEKHFYEARTKTDHLHLACFRCGRIEEFASPLFDQLKEQISRETGFSVRVARLEVGGSCPNCLPGEAAGQQQMEAMTETQI